MKTIPAKLHDGSEIKVEVSGSGPAVLLPVNPIPITGAEADEKQKWGVDPALGQHLIEGLNDKFTIVAFDYEGHRMAHPAPLTLTPENITKDILAIADAANVKKFAYYGYSWLALCALQLGIRTDRLWAIIMGAFPPIDGPYLQMLAVTKATYEMAANPAASAPKDPDNIWDSQELTISADQTKQFFTLYEALKNFDDHAAQSKLTCPRLCFAGSADKQEYSERWGGVTVEMVAPLVNKADELKKYGWDIKVLEGLDHITAMQPKNALPVIRPWLLEKTN